MKAPLKPRGKGVYTFVVELGQDAEGRRLRKRHTIHGTRKEAEAERIRILHELERGLYCDPAKITLSEYLDWWLTSCVQSSVAQRTYESYSALVRLNVAPLLGSVKLGKLNALQLQSLYGTLLTEGRKDGAGGLSPQTVLHVHRVLHKALKEAVKTGQLVRNPCDLATPPKVVRKSVQTLNSKQLRALLSSAEGSSYRVPILVAATTGVRLGELLGLRWQDVNLDAGTLSVRQTLQATKEKGLIFKEPKTGKERTIQVSAGTVSALRQHRKEQAASRLSFKGPYQDHGLVFCRDDGAPWHPSTFSSGWGRLREQFGVDIRWHDLRHSCATILMTAGEHFKVVQEMLGHSTITTTMDLYSHVLPTMQKQAAATMDRELRLSARRPAKRRH